MKLKEECGIFGAISRSNDVLPLVFEGIFALQHRGQEGAGFAAVGEEGVVHYKGLGLISEVLERAKKKLGKKNAFLGIAHTRYSTHGNKITAENVQPFLTFYGGKPLAIVHNGNVSNAHKLRKKLEEDGTLFYTDSDTEILLQLYVKRGKFSQDKKNPFFEAKGAYSLLILEENRLTAVRDPWGFRPLVLGERGDTLFFSSETAALDAVGANLIREIEPGETIIASRDGSMKSIKFPKSPSFCVFELIYFARPDSIVFGEGVYSFRKKTGEKLAIKEHKMIDVVVPIPDSGLAASLGYAKKLEIPLELGLIRSHYIGRSFIEPDNSSRSASVRRKLLPLREVLEGKSVALVDDSIVRGTTARAIVKLVREFGAREIHYRVASPPLLRPCFFGIDMPTVGEFIASKRTLGEIEAYLKVDSLLYLDIEELKEILGRNSKNFCYACFTGNYPENSLPEGLSDEISRWPYPPILKGKKRILGLFEEKNEI